MSALQSALKVNVEVFEGPLDLLLYLIRKDELDIYDIPIAQLTREYLAYLELMDELNLDVAGEFLVMAATLTQIKSRMLLPRPEGEGEDVDEDPRAELVRRLLEYQRYKEASQELEEREILGFDVFVHPAEVMEEPVEQEEQFDVTLFDLVLSLKAMLEQLPEPKYHQVVRETVTISQRIYEVMERMRGRERVEFRELFTDATTRPLVIITFLSLLELMKLKLIRCQQAAAYGEIHIYPSEDLDSVDELAIDDYETNSADGASE